MQNWPTTYTPIQALIYGPLLAISSGAALGRSTADIPETSWHADGISLLGLGVVL